MLAIILFIFLYLSVQAYCICALNANERRLFDTKMKEITKSIGQTNRSKIKCEVQTVLRQNAMFSSGLDRF